jgi:hypothetical protein
MSAREAVLYYAHFASPAVRREAARLQDEVGSTHDVFVTGYCRRPDDLARVQGIGTRPYVLPAIRALPYPVKLAGFNPANSAGNNDLAVLRFFLDHPGYERYWIIEYDVRLSGRWSDLFAELDASPADLLCTTVMSRVENPDWLHWTSLRTGADIVQPDHWVKGFLPFCRVSAKALRTIDERYRAGWGGHPEVAWPTILFRAGLGLEDVGGHGSFTPPDRRGRYYFNTPSNWAQFPGTFIFRPAFADTNNFGPNDNYGKNILWHPVKET